MAYLHAVELAFGTIGVVFVACAGGERDAVGGDQSDQCVEQRGEVEIVGVQENGLAREKTARIEGTSCGRERAEACRETSERRPPRCSCRFYHRAHRTNKHSVLAAWSNKRAVSTENTAFALLFYRVLRFLVSTSFSEGWIQSYISYTSICALKATWKSPNVALGTSFPSGISKHLP